MAKDGLQKLNRAELLKLLLEVEEENEHLRKQVEDLQAQLDDRTIRIEKSGDLATAALQLNGVFEAADAAWRMLLHMTSDHIGFCMKLGFFRISELHIHRTQMLFSLYYQLALFFSIH